MPYLPSDNKYSNPLVDKGNSEPSIGPESHRGVFRTLLQGPELPKEDKAIKNEQKKKPEKPKEFSGSRHELEKAIRKAYEPYAYLNKDQKEELIEDLKTKREKTVTGTDANKFVVELKSKSPFVKRPFFIKVWEKFSKKNS